VTLLQVLQYSGVAVFAVSGALAAGRKSLDLLGVVVIATVTAIGGGTLRDLLLDLHPVFWIREPAYLLVVGASALLTIPYVRVARPPEKFLQIADALGLALFSISGARIAENMGHPGLILVVMGTITGAFGGVVRDVLCNEIPMILRRGQIYATAAIAGVALYVALQSLGVTREIAAVAGMATIAVLRIAAITFNLQLPVFTLPGAE
jgi:uncharacterized membrane protein YeiH